MYTNVEMFHWAYLRDLGMSSSQGFQNGQPVVLFASVLVQDFFYLSEHFSTTELLILAVSGTLLDLKMLF